MDRFAYFRVHVLSRSLNMALVFKYLPLHPNDSLEYDLVFMCIKKTFCGEVFRQLTMSSLSSERVASTMAWSGMQ